ncbi:integral membrane sensor signal transduction histidine kinase [Leptolyngbya sp. Heron Island J]|uniref:sensor histidine kinase n=1 Tax=Leptolyngbya sp. Heron Island J TaxID=1385935 RepID=UPI0003B9A0F9|nr:ATP-binding protein [Leptolyngbya sp. Heron Island J]ESA38673.1 integral membrane sensor signal transduction histidine kinase [Leptolyngbya sp. Heron Island J]
MKYRKPWYNLRLRLVAWYSLLAGLSMLVSDGFMYLRFRQTLFDQIDNALEVTTIQALKNLDDEVDALMFDPRQEAPALASLLNDAGVEIYLLAQDGSLKEYFGDSLTLPTQQGLQPGFKTLVTENGRWRLYTQEILPRADRPPGWLTVARSLQPVDITLQNLLNQHLLKVPLLLGMVGLGGLFLANRALKPIGQITRIAEQVSVSGDLTQRIRYQGTTDDELERLATMFDEMLDSLQATFEHKKRFTADASHELRTPLTTLKGRLHVALSQPRTAEIYQETLQGIEQEVDRLIRLSSDLLLLSRLEQQHQDMHLELIDLSDLLAAIAEQIQPLADLQQLQFSTHIPSDLQIQGSPDHLIRLFLNLLDNAVKHTSAQGKVQLRAMVQGHCIQINVSDTGIGISPKHLPHLFERFYRVEKSRSRTIGGTGLGLAIAQEIVHRHHGAIAVQSQPGHGTTFTVTFPKYNHR